MMSFLPLLLVGCPDGTQADTQKSDSVDSTDSPADSSSDSGLPTLATPCADGTYGPWIPDPAAALFVRVDGDDAAAGTQTAPVASLEAALILAASGGQRAISIGIGTFPSLAEISTAELDGLVVAGCGTDTLLTDVDSADPSRLVLVRDVAGLVLADFDTRGGDRAISIQDDDGSTEVTLSAVNVSSPARTGIFVYGQATVVLQDVWVDSPVPDTSGDYAIAYGISIRGVSGLLNQPNLSMEGGGIRSASVAGIVADSASVSLTDVEVSGTLPDAATGYFGRGVQVQTGSTLVVSGGSFTGNADAALFAIGNLSIELRDGAAFSETFAAPTGDGDAESGDGVVVLRGDELQESLDSTATLSGLTLDGNARAGLILEDVDYRVDDVSGENGGLDGSGGSALYALGGTASPESTATLTEPSTAPVLNLRSIAAGEAE